MHRHLVPAGGCKTTKQTFYLGRESKRFLLFFREENQKEGGINWLIIGWVVAVPVARLPFLSASLVSSLGFFRSARDWSAADAADACHSGGGAKKKRRRSSITHGIIKLVMETPQVGKILPNMAKRFGCSHETCPSRGVSPKCFCPFILLKVGSHQTTTFKFLLQMLRSLDFSLG